MVFDASEERLTLGSYGSGLAEAFGQKHGMLQNLPAVTAFNNVKLSVGGRFRFT